MNTIFLVKKDPNLPNRKDNWLNMEYEDFKCFLDSKEGTQRRKSFFYLLPVDKDDYGIVVECGEEYAQVWMREQNRSNYINRTLIETGYKLVSYYSSIRRGDGSYTFEDVLSIAEETSVEDAATLSLQIKALRAALKKLSAEEFDLVCALFLADNPMTETAFSEKSSMNLRTVYRRKADIESKLKTFMLDSFSRGVL